MKKLFIIATLVLALSSCSTSEDPEITDPINGETDGNVTPIEKEISFKVTSLNATMNNLQVQEIINYKVEITDPQNTAEVIYVLKPITDDIVKHQKNNIDYIFNSGDITPNTTKIDSIIYTAKTGTLNIKILKPGSFQNAYTIQKMIGNKKVGKPATTDILFNAVKISASTGYTRTRSANTFHHSEWDRKYTFTIDCGEQTNDDYLYSSGSKTNTYVSKWWGGEFSGNLAATRDGLNTFRNTDSTEKGEYNLQGNYTLTQIVITQKLSPTSGVNTITYKNIPISEYRY